MRQVQVLCLIALSLACARVEETAVPVAWIDTFLALDTVPAPQDSAGSTDSFGSIDAVVLLGNGRVVVVDGTNRLVRLLRNGVEVDRSGGPGDGPREFRLIRRAALIGADSVVVLDQARARLAVLWASQDSLVWVGDTVLPFPAEDVCAVGGRLFLSGRFNSLIVHEVSLQGEVRQSFGGLEGDDVLARELSAVGRLGCSADAGALAFATSTLGSVRVFTPEGAEIRRDSIPGFAATVYQMSGNVMRPGLPSQGYAHVVDALQWLGPDLLVQLSRGPRDGIGRDSRLWRGDGTWHADLPAWPRVVALTLDTALVSMVEDPYPRLVTYRVRR